MKAGYSAGTMHRLLRTAALALFALRFASSLHAQAGAATDVIVGRVTDGASGAPIDQADISASSVATGRVRTARTSADGRFQLVFADGGGRYVVRVRRLGYALSTTNVARRVESDRIRVDVALKTTVAVLEKAAVASAGDDSVTIGRSGTDRNV